MGLANLPRLGRLFGLLAIAVASCALNPAAAQTSIKFTSDWPFDGTAAPFLVPFDRGYYKAERLDVAVDDAANALQPITRVASGAYDIGIADINALIRFRDQNPTMPVKAVFMVYNRPPYAIVARKSRGIGEPSDLAGKKLGAPPASATTAQWPVFARVNKIDTSKITLENIGIPVRTPMLAAGQIDATLGFSFRVYIDLKDRGVPVDDVVLLPMANYGLTHYGNAIIVNPKFAAENPEAVRAFLRAFLRGLKETVRSPPTAVDSVLRREDIARKSVELERLRMAITENIVTPEVKVNGYGGIDPARLDDSITQSALAYTFKSKPKAADIFDPSFLPAARDRTVR